MTEYKSKVKYEAPIEINIEEDFPDFGSMAVSEIENMICSAVLKVGITVDKDELIKALRYDRGQYEKGYADGRFDAADRIDALMEENKMLLNTIPADKKLMLDHIRKLEQQLPKEGEWIWENYCWHCSACGENPTRGTGYVQGKNELFRVCPNCGAKMEVQDDKA